MEWRTARNRKTMAQITIITGPERGRTIDLTQTAAPITLGRECCDVVLVDTAVSRKHAELSLQGAHWVLADLESSNGTFINERRVTEAVLLEPNDQIRCGATVLLFELVEDCWEPQNRRTAEPDRRAETMVGLTFGTLVPKSSARRRERAAQAGLAALNVSHGIKNLLQTVTSSREVVDCALRINDIERARRGWTILNQSLDRINHLILDLLKFSRESTPVLKTCSLAQLLAQLVEAVQPEAAKKGAEIDLTVDKGVGLVPLDADLMGEAFMNLLLNAVEAVTPGEGVIRVTAQADDANDRVAIRFEDNGCGIEDTEIIFEPFHTAGKKTGTGLGLPIAAKIVGRHNGNILVQSRPGHGTIFTVTLPTAPLPPRSLEEDVP